TEQLVDRLVGGELRLGERPDLQHLPGVVPLVEGLVGVDPLVALEADQLAVEHRRQRLGQLRLPDTDLAFQQEGLAQGQRDVRGGGQTAVGEVPAGLEQAGEVGDGREGGVLGGHGWPTRGLRRRRGRPATLQRGRSCLPAPGGNARPAWCRPRRTRRRRRGSCSGRPCWGCSPRRGRWRPSRPARPKRRSLEWTSLPVSQLPSSAESTPDRPYLPRVAAMASAMTETAISAGVDAPMSMPAGPLIRLRSVAPR